MISFHTVPLSSVCQIAMGQAPNGTSYNTDKKGYALIAGAGDFGETTPNPGKWTNEPTKLSEPGDIILCIRATIGDRNWADRKYCLGRGVAGLRGFNGKLDQGYLWHWLENSKLDLKAKGRGATFLQVSKKDISTLEIPLPPLAEQKRIAAILDAADALRAKRRESLAQLDTLLQSTFLDLFGDPVTNPKGWATTTVGDEIEFLTSGSRGWAKYYSDTGAVFIRIQNLRGGLLDLSDVAFVTAPDSAEARRTRVQAGDVLLSITTDLGRTAVVPNRIGNAHINQHLAILRFRMMNSVFVSHQIASKGCQIQFVNLNRAAVKAGLNFSDIRSIRLMHPPLPLQNRFAEIVQSVERQKSRFRAHLAELDTLFASLQTRAFRGEI